MRLLSIAAILGSLAACNQHDETQKTSSVTKAKTGESTGSAAPTIGAQPAVKKPVDTKPLPELAPDKGGAGGNVQWVWTAGGIDTDGANAVAATPDGGFVIGGSFSGNASFFD